PGCGCAATELLDVDEFGILHVRLAVPRHNKAGGRIGDPIHGREANNWLWQCVPETHLPGVSSLLVLFLLSSADSCTANIAQPQSKHKTGPPATLSKGVLFCS